MKLELDSKNADVAYRNADEEGKSLLRQLYPDYKFDRPITERVKTLDDAIPLVKMCAELKAVLDYDGDNEQMKGVKAFAEVSIFREAINEGWVADYGDSDESKYSVYQKYISGVGLRYDDWTITSASTRVGARLQVKSADLAEHIGRCMEKSYTQLFTTK